MLPDIIKTSLVYRSQTVHLSSLPLLIRFREIKNPAYVSVSRVREIFIVLQNLLTPGLSKILSGCCPIRALDRPRFNAQPGLYRLRCVPILIGAPIAGQLVADMFKQLFIERMRRISQVGGYIPLILFG